MVATKQSNEVTDEAAVAQEQGKRPSSLSAVRERGWSSMAGRCSSPIGGITTGLLGSPIDAQYCGTAGSWGGDGGDS